MRCLATAPEYIGVDGRHATRESDTSFLSLTSLARYVHREVIVLAILCATAGGVFVFTRAVAGASRDMREHDARVWHERGLRALREGRAPDAVEALSRARALARDVPEYQLALSRALSDTGQRDTARQILLSLREAAPEDPEINVALAEIEAGSAHPLEALKYFQSALHGVWSADAIDARRALRRRLIDYLLDQGMASRAMAQILILQDDVPPTTGAHADVAGLFLRAGDPTRALAGYRRVLAEDPRHAGALAGAARAAFAAADYRGALRYLARLRPADPALEELRALSAAVVAADPYARGLPEREQRRRLENGRTTVAAVLDACKVKMGSSFPASLEDHILKLARPLQPGDDAVVIERAAAAVPSECGPFDPPFRAWVLLARSRPEETQ